MDLSVVVPCYNEGDYLVENASLIANTLDLTRISYELIFVDDCSTNNTRETLEQFSHSIQKKRVKSIFHTSNRGRGGAVTTGFKAASGKVVGYLDIDLEIHPCYIPVCYTRICAGADCVLGHRTYKIPPMVFTRHLTSWGYGWLRRKMVGGPECDTESGYKFFKREVILPILDRVQDQHWFWDTEVIIELYRQGRTIGEVPCLFVRRTDKHSSVRLMGDIMRYLKSLCRLRRQLRGRVRRGARSEHSSSR